MIELRDSGIFLNQDGRESKSCISKEEALCNTMAYAILKAHNHGEDMEHLKLKFDALVSPDNNYVNILQTAKASGLKEQEACRRTGAEVEEMTIGSFIVSEEIGDGSSREQAASCQKVLGGFANLANSYATKRYRSNLINWGILPLMTEEKLELSEGTWILIEKVRDHVRKGENLCAEVLDGSGRNYTCTVGEMTEEEKEILLSGCLINYYRG